MNVVKINKNFCFGVVMATIIATSFAACGQALGFWGCVIAFLISYPYRFESGIVYSIWGGFSDGDIRSLLSVFQIAKENASSLISFNLYQEAGKTAKSGLGINFIQRAKEDSLLVFGISIFQYANESAKHYLGINLFQKAEDKALFAFGLSGIQTSRLALQGITLSFLQLARETAEQEMGVGLYQKAPCVRHFIGLLLFQSFKRKNRSAVSIVALEEGVLPTA